MAKIIKNIIDYYSGAFEASIAQEDEIQECFKLRKEIFGKELKRENKNLEYNPSETDEFDDKSIHIICKNSKTGEIIGALRMTKASNLVHNKKQFKEYSLNKIPKSLWNKTYTISRLIIKKKFRRTVASLKMFEKAYEFHLLNNTDILLLVCEPNIIPIYRKLGFKPLDRIFTSCYGGYRIPLFATIHNYDYLKECRSPIFSIAKKLNFPQANQERNWEKKIDLNCQSLELGYTDFSKIQHNDFYSPLIENVSKDSVKQLFSKSIKIKCNAGDKIISKDTGGKNFGLIYSGAIEVDIPKIFTIVLASGDIFGEMGFLTGLPRSADLIAKSDSTKIIMVSESSISKIKNLKDQALIWQNLAKIIAHRLANTNNIILSYNRLLKRNSKK